MGSTLVRAAVGAVAVAVGAQALKRWQMSDHDRLVERAYESASQGADAGDSVYVDHVKSDVPTPAGELDHTDKVPDVLVHNLEGPNPVVEVETQESLAERPGEAIAQLEAFQAPGYRRILVVPEALVEPAEEFVADLEGTIRVTSPEGLAAYC